MVTCPACGALNMPEDNFCGHCAAVLLGTPERAGSRAPRTAPERRQLTVLFCDLVGSTALARKLDPEDLRRIMLEFQDATRRVVARYEGFVARYMGDGVLAYFGYPQAHEDDTVRAIHAALEIVARCGESALPHASPMARAGIATGLVVVGDWIGEGGSREAAAVGEAVNLAARLQPLADPGSVVLSDRTRALAEGRFAFDDHGLHLLKGFDEPVHAWRAVRPTTAESRFDVIRSNDLTPFVGRSHEMDLALERWHRAEQGSGQVMLIVGEPGIGKSRLVEALSERLRPPLPLQLRYQCSPYHANTALYPFVRQLERDAGFAAADTDEAKLDKLEACLARDGSTEPEALHLLAALLSLPAGSRCRVAPLTPQQQKQRTIAALAARLRRLCSPGPVVVAVEDAHWIDATSMELLDLVVSEVQGLAAAVCITSRGPPRRSWAELTHVLVLPLERLSASESATMVRSLAAGRQLPVPVIDHIVSLADGVPLFIEECTKALESAPAANRSETPIPLTLQDSLAARLDRLGVAKQVAQCAAVIGREFPRDLLGSLSGLDTSELTQALHRLLSSAVLHLRDPSEPESYVFKHALVQEAAYGSLLRSRRQELHARVAQLLEESYGDRARAEPEVLAFHLAHAGQPLRAAEYRVTAAKRALDRSANVEALGHAAEGLALLAGLEDEIRRSRIELALTMIQGTAHRAVHGFASEHVERSFGRALELCERLKDEISSVYVRRGLFSFHYARGHLEEAQGQASRVLKLAETGGDSDSRMLGLWMLGCMAFWRGDLVEARERLSLAVSIYRPEVQAAAPLALQIDPGVNALSHLSWVLWIAGEPDHALDIADRAVATARSLAQPLALAMALFFSCATRACCGQTAAGTAPLAELVAITTEHQLNYLRSCARVLVAQALIAEGRASEGIAEVETALAEFSQQQAGLGMPWSLSILAYGHLQLGNASAADAALDRGFAAAEQHGEHHWIVELWRLKAELLLLRQAPAEACACLARALSVAQSQGAHSLALRSAIRWAEILLVGGNRSGAKDKLQSALMAVQAGERSDDMAAAAGLLKRIE
jgi:class 3 adenylate cyclase/tetratricopeptide (TPR) repeat protein